MDGLTDQPNATCKKCGRIKMLFEGFMGGEMKKIFISISIFLMLFCLCHEKTFGESNEVGDFIIAEDWDVGTPPANWPECRGVSWHGWTPKDYDCSPAEGEPYANGGNSDLVTDVYYTPPRSLRVIRDKGTKDVTDLMISVSPPQPKVHVRLYMRFDSNWGTLVGEQIVHFMLFNSSRSGANFGMDIWAYTDKRQWPPICGHDSSGNAVWGFHSYHDCQSGTNCGSTWEDIKGPATSATCWQVPDHLNQWYCFEWMWDIPNKKVKMWIDGVLKIDRTMCECSYNTINKIYLEGWNSCGGCVEATAHTFWVDNIVVDDEYIGLLGEIPVTTTTIGPATTTIATTTTIEPITTTIVPTTTITVTTTTTASPYCGWTDNFSRKNSRWQWTYNPGTGYHICPTIKDGNTVVEIGITNESHSGEYSDCALSDYGGTQQHTSIGVTYEGRIKCSHSDGQGTCGWGLWSNEYLNSDAAWFWYGGIGSDEPWRGFRMMVATNGILNFNEVLTGVDMKEWHTYRVEIYNDCVIFKVDGIVKGLHYGVMPNSNLEINQWIDNRPMIGGELKEVDIDENQKIWIDWAKCENSAIPCPVINTTTIDITPPDAPTDLRIID